MESQIEETAKSIVEKCMLVYEEEPNSQHSFLYTAFLYNDLRQAITFEEGDHINHQWRRLWLVYDVGRMIMPPKLPHYYKKDPPAHCIYCN